MEAICSAIAELFWQRVLVYKEGSGSASLFGEVTEKFASGAVVAKMQNAEFGVGDTLYASGDACCYPVIIKSIRVEDQPQERVTLTAEREIGLMFDHEVKKNRRLYRLN